MVELELPTYQLDEGFGPWWRALAEAFEEENPGYRINLVSLPFNEHHDQLTTRLVSGNPPDIAHISGRFMFGLADSGLLEPLDDYLSEIGWEEDDFIPSQEQMRIDGSVYAQILLGYGWGLFYNKAMFDEAGIEVPTTPEQFVDAAKELTRDTDGDGRTDQYGFAFVTDQSTQSYFELTYMLAGLGHGWTENGDLIARDDLYEAIAMMDELLEAGTTPTGLNSSQRRQLFWQGQAAMYIDGSWAPAFKEDAAEDVAENFDVAPLPFLDEASGPSNTLAIPADLDEDTKQMAFEFIKMAQSPEWQRKYGEISGNPPAREGMLTDKAREDWPHLPVFEASTERASYSYLPEGLETEYNEFSSIITENISALASGQLDADEATDEIYDRLRSEFF
ncbi:MAG: extracellular solute-binding protein [Spirochaetes bacterium]|nr:extracellular solute-binding protein [Spirochaetota bacterium]